MKNLKLIIFIFVLFITATGFCQSEPVLIDYSSVGSGINFKTINVITDLNEDLWIAHYKAGISWYEGTEFSHFNNENSGLTTDTIYDIYIDGNTIYASTFKGICKADYTANPIVWDTYPETSTYVVFTLIINNGYVYALAGTNTNVTHLIKINI